MKSVVSVLNFNKKTKRFLYVFFSALITGIVFCIPNLAWIIWISFVPFFLSLYQKELSIKRGLKYFFTFGLIFYLVILHWLVYMHPLTWLGFSNNESLLIVFLALVGFSIYESLYLGLIGVVIGYIKPRGFYKIVIPPLLWMMAEWLQRLGLFGFTWGNLSVSQHKFPIIQILSFSGPYLITGLIILLNTTLASLIYELKNVKEKYRRFFHKPISYLPITIVLSIILIFNLYGIIILIFNPSINSENSEDLISVTVIQGNIPQRIKWGNNKKDIEIITNTQLDLTYKSLKEVRPDIVVWAETVIPVFLKDNFNIIKKITQLNRVFDSYLLSGFFDYDIKSFNNINFVKIYNGAVVINNNGELSNWYYKRHLVPFGEFNWPWRKIINLFFPKFEKINAIPSDITPGKTVSVIDTNISQIGTLICFDSIFPELAAEAVRKGAQILVVITNDAWFGNSIAPYFHNIHSIMRAIENRRFVIRSANTGISCIIDPYGRIIKKIDIFKEGFINSKVQKSKIITLYNKLGDWPIYIGFIIFLILLGTKEKEDKQITVESKVRYLNKFFY